MLLRPVPLSPRRFRILHSLCMNRFLSVPRTCIYLSPWSHHGRQRELYDIFSICNNKNCLSWLFFNCAPRRFRVGDAEPAQEGKSPEKVTKNRERVLLNQDQFDTCSHNPLPRCPRASFPADRSSHRWRKTWRGSSQQPPHQDN